MVERMKQRGGSAMRTSAPLVLHHLWTSDGQGGMRCVREHCTSPTWPVGAQRPIAPDCGIDAVRELNLYTRG